MKPSRPDSVRSLAAAAGLSLSQMAQAKKEGVDCKNPAALKAFRARTNTRCDDRNSAKTEQPELSAEMSITEMESALRSKGITTNDARTLKIQIEGMKQVIAIRKEMAQLIPRTECEEDQAKTAHAINAMLRAMENDIPALCYGRPLNEVKEQVKIKTRELQAALSNAQSEFWDKHPAQ